MIPPYIFSKPSANNPARYHYHIFKDGKLRHREMKEFAQVPESTCGVNTGCLLRGLTPRHDSTLSTWARRRAWTAFCRPWKVTEELKAGRDMTCTF